MSENELVHGAAPRASVTGGATPRVMVPASGESKGAKPVSVAQPAQGPAKGPAGGSGQAKADN